MSECDGGQAFPVTSHPSEMVESYGMTLRDYFAGQAIGNLTLTIQPQYLSACAEVAAYAYRMADAMLKERAK